MQETVSKIDKDAPAQEAGRTLVVVNTLSEDDKFRVTILLKEYDTLRQEILGRIKDRFTLIGIGGGLGVLLGMQQPAVWRIVLLTAWAVAAVVLWWWTGLLIFRCSLRVGVIERQINELAGAKLLQWETDTEYHQRKAWWRTFYPNAVVKRQPDQP